MPRPTTRTELLSGQSRIGIEDFFKTQCASHAAFHAKFLSEEMSYPTYYAAVSGSYSTQDIIDAIDHALETALHD